MPNIPAKKLADAPKRPERDESQVVLQAAPSPVAVSLPETATVLPDTVQAVESVQSARTAAIVETVNEIVEIVVREIEVSPTLVAGGDGEMTIRLKPAVLDGSEIKFVAKEGHLSLTIVPSTPQAAMAVAQAISQVEAALSAHAPAFQQVSVAVAALAATGPRAPQLSAAGRKDPIDETR